MTGSTKDEGDPYHDFERPGHLKRWWGLSSVKGVFMQLRRFQKEFLDKALAPGIDIAALESQPG